MVSTPANCSRSRFRSLVRRFCGCFTFLADLTFGQQLSGRCAFRIAAQTEIPRLFFRHIIDERGNLCFLRKLTGFAAAVAGNDLKLAILALPQDNRLLYAF